MYKYRPCLRCLSTNIKRNGYTNTLKPCNKSKDCKHKFVEKGTDWFITLLDKNIIKRMLLECISLRGMGVYLTGMKVVNDKKQTEYLIVATYKKDLYTMQVYAKRWTIECFFKAIKSAGFNIEDTHIKDIERLEKLFALVAIAFTWLYLIGQYQNNLKSIPILAHKRRAFSLFRYGLDAINKALVFDYQLVTTFVMYLETRILKNYSL